MAVDSGIIILSADELRTLVPLDGEVVDCVAQAFRALAGGDVVQPPVLSFQVPEYNGEIDIKTAYVPGLDTFAVKMSPGFFDNPKIGLPSLNGLMVVFAAKTGLVEALLLDGGYLTDIRTAAAGAVAARYLARRDAKTAGVIGTGMQARLQIDALMLERSIETVLVWGRDPAKAQRAAADIGARHNVDAKPARAIGDVMAAADVVITTTPSQTPLITAADLRPGQHITAMGSDAEYKCELAPDVIAAADLFVCDRVQQSQTRGELRAALAAGAIDPGRTFRELGGIVADRNPARTTAEAVTVCDLTGTGVQDTAIAALALTRARKSGAGTVFKN